MKTYINLVKETQDKLEVIQHEQSCMFKQAELCSTVTYHAILKLKKLAVRTGFETYDDEISFFKAIKAPMVGNHLFYKCVYDIELKRFGNTQAEQEHFIKRKLQIFKGKIKDNQQFVEYYRSRRTDKDEKYFLRENRKQNMIITECVFCRDPDFSTGFDYMISFPILGQF